MNAIIGMSHLALQTDLNTRQRNYVEKVHRSAEHLMGIINDILDFSKIEAGKMTVERTEFRLEDVLDNLANLLGTKAEDKGLELLFKVAPGLPHALVGDPLRLGQILINLATNAVKFTSSGEIVLGVEPVALSGDQIEMHFWVRDTGIGMTPEQLARLFQSFSQADTSTTRKYGGTGLGLAISKKLVELMDGRIWADSEAGKGSTFHFHARFGVPAEAQPRRMFSADQMKGIRMLVVDDNQAVREILSEIATSFGLSVDTASDGDIALNMVKEAKAQLHPYRLTLMDWRMPRMDGVTCAERLQKAEGKDGPVVIMVTAFGREDAQAAAEQRGVRLDHVLTKPVTPSTLFETIGEAIGKGRAVELGARERTGDSIASTRQIEGARLLLVEDNDLNQELALELLRGAGIEVALANNGQEALDLLAQGERFDGVLMDCQMPVMDGYTATRRIRENPALASLPVIAMTASAMESDKELVRNSGMDDYIGKPLNVNQMFATIARWVKPSRPGAAAQPRDPESPKAPLPAELPGIDTAAGLATAAGNEQLYRKLLGRFRDGQGRFAELFRSACSDPDPRAAERTAHTLKGTAASIGAKRLAAAAAELERACAQRGGPQAIEPALAAVLAELEPVIGGLAQLCSEKPQPSAAPAAIDRTRVEALLTQLDKLLSQGDTRATEAADSLSAATAGTALAAAARRVASSVSNYDFEEASGHLASLRKLLASNPA